jgi:RNA polymerase sigma-70 factor, ECF subfamily
MTTTLRFDPSDEPTDRALVGRILSDGSEEAARTLYRRHSPHLFSVARRLVTNEADAEDAVQEVWLRAAASLARFAWQSQLHTWLVGITINVAREILSRRARRDATELPLTDELPLVAADEADRLDLERAIGRLPTGYRVAFVLHDIEGFSHADVARQMRWSESTSKTQLFKARRVLRSLLAGQVMKAGRTYDAEV